MATALQVAEWMVKQFETPHYVYQATLAYQIKQQFGSEFVYINANSNYAISKDVLKHFRKLTEGKIVWVKGEQAWRKLNENETYEGRQIG